MPSSSGRRYASPTEPTARAGPRGHHAPAPLARYRTEAVAGQPSQAPRVRCYGASRRFGISPALNLLRSLGALRSTSTSLPRRTFSMAGQRASRRRMRSASGSSGSTAENRAAVISAAVRAARSCWCRHQAASASDRRRSPRRLAGRDRRLAFVGGLVVRCRLTR